MQYTYYICKHIGGCKQLPSAWPRVASPFWFMLFFLRCFFLSVTGEADPTSLVEGELETPSNVQSNNTITEKYTKLYTFTVSELKEY